jgi:hypothetical protein
MALCAGVLIMAFAVFMIIAIEVTAWIIPAFIFLGLLGIISRQKYIERKNIDD